jgi:WD domain, G-beta repeat
MPFLVNCTCGKKLRVADEIQGKKVRCPACQALVVAQPEPAARAAAPKAGREEAAEEKRRTAPPEDEANGEAPPKRARRDETEDDEERSARKRKPDPDEDEAPARPRRKKKAQDDDEDDRPVKKTKKSGSKTWLWLGCGCSSLLFLGCAGVIVLAAIFGKSSAAELAGNWEIDRDAAADVNPQFLASHSLFGYRFLNDGQYEIDENEMKTIWGHWKPEKKDDKTFLLRMTHGDTPGEFTEEVTIKDADHIQIRREKGEVVPLKRQPDGKFASIDPKTLTKKGGGDGKTNDGGPGKTLALLKEHTKDVTSLAFWGDDLLASASWDGTVKVWQLPAEKSKFTLTGHTGQARSVAFLSNGQALASGGGNPDPSAKGGEVKVWDVTAGTERSTPYKGERPVETVAANRNGRILAWSNMADVVIWDVSGNKQAATLPGHSWEVAAVAIPETGRTVAVAGGQELKLWDMPTIAARPGKPAIVPTAARLTLKTQYMLHSVAFSPDGLFVAGGGEGAVTVWDVGSGAQKWTAKTVDAGDAKGVAFSRDGQAVVAACGTVQFWDLATGADLGEWKSDFKEGHYPYSVAFSSDGKKMATGALSGTIKLWDFSKPPAPKR